MTFIRRSTKLFADERGVSAIEYALLAALIALGMVTSVEAAGRSVAGTLNVVQEALADAMDSGKGKPDKEKPPKKEKKK